MMKNKTTELIKFEQWLEQYGLENVCINISLKQEGDW